MKRIIMTATACCVLAVSIFNFWVFSTTGGLFSLWTSGLNFGLFVAMAAFLVIDFFYNETDGGL